MRKNQRQRIIDALKMGKRCGTDFLGWDPPIARYSARIEELRKEGYRIVTEPCKLHQHTYQQFAYRLETEDQGALF